MSYASSAAKTTETSKVGRLTAAVRRSWTEARHADRQLMALRTSLTRHVG
ncbi:MAG: hypothetical protein QM747_15270 [Nocardioides sp.]